MTRYTIQQEMEMARGERDLEMWDREFPQWEDNASDPERFVSEADYYGHEDRDEASEAAYDAWADAQRQAMMESVWNDERTAR